MDQLLKRGIREPGEGGLRPRARDREPHSAPRHAQRPYSARLQVGDARPEVHDPRCDRVRPDLGPRDGRRHQCDRRPRASGTPGSSAQLVGRLLRLARPYTAPDKLYHNVVDHVRAGDVILLHQTHPESIRALPRSARSLKARGYKMVTLSKLASVSRSALTHPRSDAPRLTYRPARRHRVAQPSTASSAS